VQSERIHLEKIRTESSLSVEFHQTCKIEKEVERRGEESEKRSVSDRDRGPNEHKEDRNERGGVAFRKKDQVHWDDGGVQGCPIGGSNHCELLGSQGRRRNLKRSISLF